MLRWLDSELLKAPLGECVLRLGLEIIAEGLLGSVFFKISQNS